MLAVSSAKSATKLSATLAVVPAADFYTKTMTYQQSCFIARKGLIVKSTSLMWMN